jgi:hypothetical protein
MIIFGRSPSGPPARVNRALWALMSRTTRLLGNAVSYIHNLRDECVEGEEGVAKDDDELDETSRALAAST